MEPMFLSEVEKRGGRGGFAEMIKAAKRAGGAVPQIFYLFAYKPGATEHLSRFTHEVMRGAMRLGYRGCRNRSMNFPGNGKRLAQHAYWTGTRG